MAYVSHLKKLEDWYRSQCDGEWEHQCGIEIGNLDNPGWYVCVDLKGTNLEAARMNRSVMDNDDNDWMFLEIKDCQFLGRGDPGKLQCIVEAFLVLVATYQDCPEMDTT